MDQFSQEEIAPAQLPRLWFRHTGQAMSFWILIIKDQEPGRKGEGYGRIGNPRDGRVWGRAKKDQEFIAVAHSALNPGLQLETSASSPTQR
jgi:hypothetical protein